MLLQWNESLSVGHETIDEHHKVLLQLIRNIFAAMSKGGKGGELIMHVEKMIDFAKYHFEHEERYMHSWGYPQLQAHQKVHRGVIAKMEEFKQQIQTSPALGAIALSGFLKDWLVNHIMKIDKRYSTYIPAGKC